MGRTFSSLGQRRLPFQVTLLALLLPLVLGSGALISWIGYRRSSAMLASASAQMLAAVVGQLRGSLSAAVDPQRATAELERLTALAGRRNLAQRLEALPLLRQALAQTPNLRAYFIGYADGQFLLVARASDSDGRRLPDLPPQAALVVESLAPDTLAGAGSTFPYKAVAGLRHQQLILDHRLQPLPAAPRLALLSRDFDPRRRPWYRLALESSEPVLSPVYRLAFGQRLGMTLSRALPQRRGAVGTSLELASLQDVLERHRPTPGSALAIVSDRGLVIASTRLSGGAQPELPALAGLPHTALAGLAHGLRQRADDGLRSVRVAGERWRRQVVALPNVISGRSLYLAVAIPERELLADARQQQREALLSTALVMLLMVPLVVLVSRSLSRALIQLARQADQVRQFSFESGPPLRSVVLEIDTLSLTLDSMRRTIRRFLDISALLAAEDDVDQLLERLLDESIPAAGAAAGALYLPADRSESAELRPRLLRSQGKDLDTALLPPLQRDDLPALQRDGRLNGRLQGCLNGQPPGAGSAAAGAGAAGAATIGLALPLEDRSGRELLGLLLLWFDIEPEQDQVAFCRALSGSAAVALETRELIADQKRLFEAFIRLIADAIDAKSPYTGGHCARVPELTKMLAAAACKASDGPFATFQLSAAEWEALHVAAWLHDCGKVTTPDHVVDKATKLETIHDRIHEVRMRFELLKAEAECEHWRARCQGGDPDQLQQQLEQSWRQLDEEFAFVATCNIGGELMEAERIARLRRIAGRTWRRTLDDRLGISNEELRRRQRRPVAELPVREPLLSDQDHHLVERGERDRLDADNPWGFRMTVPEHLYNHGELHNLEVERGTLSPEERFKINDHIIQTIRMLSALPFPRHLRAVPEIAGGHHETMDGRGYPRGLRREQMSELARMMAIADIFEALTAADRPYKSGKTLAEALAIMARMASAQHIDTELFALFLRAGVHRRYAEAHLAPEQIDAVDVEGLLAGLAHA